MQQQYLRRNSSVQLQEAEAENGPASGIGCSQSDNESHLRTGKNLPSSGSMMRGTSCIFKSEVQNAKKHFIDAREVCLIEWELRDRIVDLLGTLCTCIKEMVSGNHGTCHCSKQESICKTYEQHSDRYLKSLTDVNRDLENLRPVSQCLDNTLLNLRNIYKSLKDFSSAKGTKVDKQDMVDSIDDLLQFYTLLGTHSTSLFSDKNDVYKKLKERSYRICCACGIRTPISEDLEELKDALSFKELHTVDDDEVVAYEALKEDEEDELGALAQEAFYIAYVESDNRYYHLLNIEHPRKGNPSRTAVA